jgi:cysteine desulfurase family protein (TIGR01976 family)
MSLDLAIVRSQFPSLERDAIFFDNPGGTQICRASAARIQRYFMECNANHGGVFQTSRDSDALVAETRRAMADFLNAARPEEIVLGPNMTSLTFNLSRSLARTFNPGDTIVVTRLDHDANVSPWLLAAEDRGCRIRWVDFHPEDGTLDLDDLQAALDERPRLVAVGYASNALGTINPVETITQMAHAAGALVYIDAVQYAPHGPIDVQKLGCDFLVCSSYKFFGPHLGILYGRYDLLDHLPAYRVRPAPQDPPGKFETGTGNFEHMAGLLGALEYFEWIGHNYGEEFFTKYANQYQGRALALKQAMSAVQSYEFELSRALLAAFRDIPGLKLYGLTDPHKVDQRVPTFALTLKGYNPEAVAQRLGDQGLYVWNGNFYALSVTQRLGLENQGGLVRVGAVHYNTLKEVEALRAALAAL